MVQLCCSQGYSPVKTTWRVRLNGSTPMGRASQVHHGRRGLMNGYARRARSCCGDSGWGRATGWRSRSGPVAQGPAEPVWSGGLFPAVCVGFTILTGRGVPETIWGSRIAEMQLLDKYLENEWEHAPKWRGRSQAQKGTYSRIPFIWMTKPCIYDLCGFNSGWSWVRLWAGSGLEKGDFWDASNIVSCSGSWLYRYAVKTHQVGKWYIYLSCVLYLW